MGERERDMERVSQRDERERGRWKRKREREMGELGQEWRVDTQSSLSQFHSDEPMLSVEKQSGRPEGLQRSDQVG